MSKEHFQAHELDAVSNELSDAQEAFDALVDDAGGFRLLAAQLRARTGIALLDTPKNRTLMASRLNHTLRQEGLGGYAALLERLERGEAAGVALFITSLTTNTTDFFREANHFEILQAHVKARLAQARGAWPQELTIWCAASSTGQEVYTILMALTEVLGSPDAPRVKVLASDIDRHALEKASAALYTAQELRAVPPYLRNKYFDAERKDAGADYRVKRALREQITFATFNLMSGAYPFKNGFDYVFCRNVLIYFERPTATGVCEKLFDKLRPGGLLFVGHSETGLLRGPKFESVAPAVYARRG